MQAYIHKLPLGVWLHRHIAKGGGDVEAPEGTLHKVFVTWAKIELIESKDWADLQQAREKPVIKTMFFNGNKVQVNARGSFRGKGAVSVTLCFLQQLGY